MPPGERKSGIPDSVEMPAPVKATMRLAEPISSRSSSISSMSPPGDHGAGMAGLCTAQINTLPSLLTSAA
jgi:hypothetical protein